MAMIFRQPGETGMKNYKNMDLSIKNKNHISEIISNRNKRMKLNSTIFFLCAGLCSSAIVNNAFSMGEDNKGRLNQYAKFIASKYFESESDHVNLVMSTPELELNMEKFHYNPVALTVDNTYLFPNIRTVVLKHNDNVSEIINQLCEDVINYHVTEKSFGTWSYYLSQSNNIYFDAARNIVRDIKTQEQFVAFIERINADIISDKELNGLKDSKIERRILELLDLYNMFKKYGRVYNFEEYVIESKPDLFNRNFYKSFLRNRHFRILQHQPRHLLNFIDGTKQFNLHRLVYSHKDDIYEVHELVNDELSVEKAPPVSIVDEDIKTLADRNENLKEILDEYLPQVDSIDGFAFSGCTQLKSIAIPPSIKTIETGTFMWCTELEFVRLPSTITSIKSFAFHKCDKANFTVPYEQMKKYLVSEHGISEDKITLERDELSDANEWAWNENIVVPDSVNAISDAMFNNRSDIKSITIPSSVKSIGNNALSACRKLFSITIPDRVTSIDHYAFAGNDSLNSITIPYSISSMGDSILHNCRQLNRVNVRCVYGMISTRDIQNILALFNNSGVDSNKINFINSKGDIIEPID